MRARVDTHWKKDILIPKRVTRTDSQRAAASSIAPPPAAAAVPKAVPRLVRAKTVQTAEPKEAVRIQITNSRGWSGMKVVSNV